uniref:Immunoglobulin V-set domain-containing protein n=1 Tax=Anabas testudineus TaxID=64144 RepID=A0A7N6ARN0_ANATE
MFVTLHLCLLSQGEDDLQDPAAHQPDLMSLWLWTFTIRPDRSSKSIFISCGLMTRHKTLFHLHDGVEVSESQDQQFLGRVQFNKDVLREGRIRLQLSRLRTNDSGLYLCELRTNDGFSSDRCRLNVAWRKDRPLRCSGTNSSSSTGQTLCSFESSLE